VARDFTDVRLLARGFGKDVLLARATQIDAGFDARVLAGMIATLVGSPTTKYPCPKARQWPNCGPSTRPGDPN
jgi:hypothetical protein